MRSPLLAAPLWIALGLACGRAPTPAPTPKTSAVGSTGQLVTGTATGTTTSGPGATSGSGTSGTSATSTSGGTTSGVATSSGTTGGNSSAGAGTTGSTATASGAPTALSATADIRSAALSWTAPVSDGGSAITRYVVSITPSASGAQVVVTGTSAAITGLLDGTSYSFTVAAVNSAGQGPDSAPASATTPGLPGAPTSVVATLGDSSASVTWAAPTDDGGRPISSYVLSIQPAEPGARISFAGTSAAIDQLQNGVSYSFTVAAVSAVGRGPVSLASAPVTPADTTAPAPITDLRVELLDDARARLTWSASGDDGLTGLATSYAVRIGRDAACPLTTATFEVAEAVDAGALAPQAGGAAESLIADVGGLGAGTVCFALEAVDEAGNAGPLSNVATPPGRPMDLAAGLGTRTTQSLGWTAVGDDGASGTASAQELRLAQTSGPCPAPDALASPQVLPQTAPLAAGSAEQATLTGLTDGQAYCLALRVADAEGNAAFSPVLAFTAHDSMPPSAVTLSNDPPGPRDVTLHWAAPGDDGASGTASGYQLRFATGPNCAAAFGFASATALSGLPAPSASGSAESYAATGLAPATHHCFALRALDAAGNAAPPSAVLELDTAADTTAPAAPALSAPSAGEVTSTTALLRWIAPADDGSDPTTGPAASYDLRYLHAPGADCASLGSADFTGATHAATPAPSAPGASESVGVTLPVADQDVGLCFALSALDAAGNASALSAWRYARDNTPPARVTDLAVAATSETSAHLTFTAPGDDGTQGRAASYALRSAPGPCPTDADAFFASASAVTGLGAPKAAGGAEALDLSGLSRAVGRCYAVRAQDEVPNLGPVSDLAYLPPSPVAQLQAVRDAIGAGPGPSVALPNLLVNGAVVTYLKPGVGGASAGSADGPGFFVQAPGASGPALLLAVDPATVSGVTVGDTVDLSISQGAWLACSTPPCSATNALYAATGAQVTRTGSAALPASQDLSATNLSAGAGTNWALESERTTLSGALGTLAGSGAGFGAGRLVTAGTNSANLQLRAPRSVLYALDVAPGCTVGVAGTPLWRTDATIQAAGWLTSDLAVSGCPLFGVASTAPASGEAGVSETTVLTLTFSRPVQPTSLTGQSADGPCTGSVQLSHDGFTSCVALSALASVTGYGTVATLAPRQALLPATSYQLKLKSGAGGVTTWSGAALASDFILAAPFTTRAAPAASCPSSAQVVISQVYGGGGNAGATWANDFVELHNRGSASANLAGWSVQYAAATGSSWNVTALPSVSVPAGGYFLVQEASGGANGAALPDAGASGSMNLSASAGKVALVASTAALSGACPTGGALVDLVGYGSAATCYEGTGPAPGASNNTTTILRGGVGRCSDTQSNSADFTATGAAATAVLNGQTSPAVCECQGAPGPIENETGLGSEADSCITQFPIADLSTGADQPLPVVYGRITEAGVTDSAGASPSVLAELGYGPAGVDPRAQSGWAFVSASYNAACSGCGSSTDEYQATLPPLSLPGSYRYAFRFSVDQGQHWTWCDKDGSGSNAGQDFSLTATPLLTITP